jgi:hypothetical protein
MAKIGTSGLAGLKVSAFAQPQPHALLPANRQRRMLPKTYPFEYNLFRKSRLKIPSPDLYMSLV